MIYSSNTDTKYNLMGKTDQILSTYVHPPETVHHKILNWYLLDTYVIYMAYNLCTVNYIERQCDVMTL